MLPTKRQFSMAARLPWRRSKADPVICVRLPRKMQFRKSTASCTCPRCSTDTPAPHGLGVVPVDLDVFDRRIRPRVNLESAAVGIEEGRLPDVVRFDRRLLSGPGGEGPGACDLEAAQNGLSRHAIAEINDVVDDRGIAREVGIGHLGVGGGERHVAHGLQGDAVVTCVEPDEGLPPGGRTIGSRVNEDGLVDRIACGRFERVLDPALGKNVIAGRGFVDGDTSRERSALAQAPNGNDACRH